MNITVPGNFKGIFHCDQKFVVRPSEIVGTFISQDIQLCASQHSSMPGIREPHEVKRKSLDLGGNRTHELRVRYTVTLPTELQGRTEK